MLSDKMFERILIAMTIVFVVVVLGYRYFDGKFTSIKAETVGKIESESTFDSTDKKESEKEEETVQASQNVQNTNQVININAATREELMNLPEIGEVIAGRIIEYRGKTRFKELSDVMKVKGIGEKTFEKILPFITLT